MKFAIAAFLLSWLISLLNNDGDVAEKRSRRKDVRKKIREIKRKHLEDQ